MTRAEMIAIQKDHEMPEAWLPKGHYVDCVHCNGRGSWPVDNDADSELMPCLSCDETGKQYVSIVRDKHLVEIRAPHLGLTLRGAIDIRAASSGEFVTIGYGEHGSQFITVMNERMQVEAGTKPAIVHPPDSQIDW